MLFFIIAFFLFFYVYIKRMIQDGFSRKIILSFWAIWFISLTMSTFNPYGLYSVSDETYCILMLNVAGFILGFSAIKIERTVYQGQNAFRCYRFVNKFLVSKKYLFMLLIGIMLCGMILNKYFYELAYSTVSRTGAMAEVREDLMSVDYIFYSFLGAPLFYSSNVILAYSLIYGRRLMRDLFIYLYILIFSLIGGGRTAFLVILIAVVFVLFMGGIKIKFRKFILPLLGCGFFVYVMMAYLTAFRQGLIEFSLENLVEGASGLNENFVTYLTLPFRLFDYALHKDYLSQVGGYHYGLISFDGINRYTRLFLRLFSIDIPAITEKTTAMFQEMWIPVGKDIISNYAYTNTICHYLDFGVIGVFCIPFTFSIFVRWIIKLFYKQGKVVGLCLIFYLYYVLIHSVFTWHINKLYSLGFIVLMTIFLYRKENKYEKYKLILNENKGSIRIGK